MKKIFYKIIDDEKLYKKYCTILEELVFTAHKTQNVKDHIEMLTFLIRKWDVDQRDFADLDPVEMLHSLMADHNMNSKQLAEIIGVSKGYVSSILNYRKGFSKTIIRKLAAHFVVRQDAFNRYYELNGNKKKEAA